MGTFFEGQPCELIPGSHGEFEHWFGGDPKLIGGTTPEGQEHSVSLLYDLDLRDPVLRIGRLFPEIKRFPILNALQFNCTGLIYKLGKTGLVVEARLEEQFGGYEWDADFPYDSYPQEFPRTRVVAVPVEEFLVAMQMKTTTADGEDKGELTEEEFEKLVRCREPSAQVGGRHDMYQGIPTWDCGDESCRFHRQEFAGKEVLAVIWECPVPGVRLWDPDSPVEELGSPQIILSRCTGCNSIHSCNRAT